MSGVVNKTSVAIAWNTPTDPNGVIINYLVKFSALDWRDKPYLDPRRAVSSDLQVCFDYLGRNDTERTVESQSTQAVISGLSKCLYVYLMLIIIV